MIMDFSRRCTIFIVYFTAAWFAAVSSMNTKCNYIQNEIFEKPIDLRNKTCVNSTFCKRQYLMATINMPPFSQINIVEKRLIQCCHCVNFRRPPGRRDYFANTSELTSKEMAKFDLILPAAGHVQKQTLYGQYFIPLIEVPDYMLITRSLPTIGENMLESLNKVLPLAIICILMTLVSGFITWVFETWYNPKEFPRPLLSGWFEGTWWSFISMTTVGYGDKTPRSCPGRIFAIGWILIGITMFGILTGLLTTAIDSAQNPAVPEMKNEKIGILKYRTLDLYFVTEKGGNAVKANSKFFEEDVIKLLQLLKKGEIKGVCFDIITYNFMATFLYKTWKASNYSMFGNQSKAAEEAMEFFRNDAAKYKKTYTGDKMAYGLLVKDQGVYAYFRDAFVDNRMLFTAETRVTFSNEDLPEQPRIKLFELSSPYFIKASWILAVIIGGLLVIGFVIEVLRKSGVCQLKSDSIDTTKRNENAMTEF